MNEKKRAKERGQSLVLVAAAMVALVMFVAVAVDASNAYYHRRTAQNGADAAALAGASRLATGINNLRKLDGQIQEDMNEFAEANGIPDTDAILANAVNANVEGWYVDTSGNRLPGEPMVGNGIVPEGAYGVEAITHITATAYFGGIFGVDGYPLQARAVSQIKLACGSDCLVPIVTGDDLLLDDFGEPRVGECFHIWKERVVNKNEDISAGLLGWVSWTWQQSVCTGGFACEGVRPCPLYDQGNGCDAVLLESNISPGNCASGFVKVGDWIAAAPGDMSSSGVRCALDYYIGFEDFITNPCADGEPHSFTVPVYDYTTKDLGVKSSSCGIMSDPCNINTIGVLHYHVAGLARMQILQYQLSEGVGAVKYPSDDVLDPVLLDRINSCASYYDFACDPVLDPTCNIDDKKKNGFRITVEFLEYVQDYSSSDECYDPTGTLWSSPRLTE